ncbi:MAG: glycoside hydrolase family 43 protein [Promicromonosporaceae bacterium]|nr:glycoside hydrolase family 43 protein [Promicromonosporaceae bacterium]
MAASLDPAWVGSTNPVLPGFYPDPSVCRVDGEDGTWFYLASSTFEYLPGIPVHRSRDLVSWELVGHAVERPGQVDLGTVGDSGGMFAPTIRHDGARFLVVCTLVGGVEGASGNFVVTATDAAGPWSDPVWWHDDGIDPSLLVDDDGRLWGHGTRLAREPEWDQQTEVWVREVDPVTLTLQGPEHVVWTGAVRGAVWAEGPHLYRRGDTCYLLAAEGGTGAHHAISVARGAGPAGPFTGNPCNPVLTHRHLGGRYPVTNVGHADLVDAPDGSTWALCLATRPVDGFDPLGRETFLVPVEWEQGWPVFAPGVGTLVPEPPRPAPAPVAGAREEELISPRRFPGEVADVTPDGGLEVRPGAGLGSPAPAFVGRRLTAHRATASVEVLDVPDGAEAGVALRYRASAWVSLTVTPHAGGALLRAVRRAGDAEEVVAELTVAGPAAGTAVIEVDGARGHARWLAADGTVVDVADLDLSHLGAAASGGFVGVVVGVVAVGTGADRVRARALAATPA